MQLVMATRLMRLRFSAIWPIHSRDMMHTEHDQHGVRVFAELDKVGHTADDAVVGYPAESGLVDRSIATPEPVIGPVEFAACLFSVRRGPAFICDCRTRRARSRRPSNAARRFADGGILFVEREVRRDHCLIGGLRGS